MSVEKMPPLPDNPDQDYAPNCGLFGEKCQAF